MNAKNAVVMKVLLRPFSYEFLVKRVALQACGSLFTASPILMLSACKGLDIDSFDNVMHCALSSSAECGLKEQGLQNLLEYLETEETKNRFYASILSRRNVSASE